MYLILPTEKLVFTASDAARIFRKSRGNAIAGSGKGSNIAATIIVIPKM
jgi:hypothetical protein